MWQRIKEWTEYRKLKAQYETKIQNLISVDPPNLMLRAEDFRREAQNLGANQIQEGIKNIDRELEEMNRKKKQIEKELNALQREN